METFNKLYYNTHEGAGTWEIRKVCQQAEAFAVNTELDYYFVLYAGLGAAAAVSLFFRNRLMADIIVRNGRSLHDQLLASVFRAPIVFFDAVSLPKINNCFSKDMESLDTQIHRCLPTFAILLLDIIGLCLTIGISIPFLFPALLQLGVFYWYVQRRFRPLIRDLQRLESASRPPILTHFSETWDGMSTIRAYGQLEHQADICSQHIDSSNRGFFAMHNANRWLQLRLEFLDVLLFIAVAGFSIHGRSRGTVSVGIAALTMFYAQSCSQCSSLNFTLRMANETEAKMTATERIQECISAVNNEAPLLARNPPPNNWPSVGRIEFRDVSMRYRTSLPFALKSVSFVVEGGTNVGICGQRGSGKTSIFDVLFRMSDICWNIGCGQGSISIDGVSIGSLGLHDLRKILSIIPQDAVMFAGTVKDNLDLLHEHTEEELWRVVGCASLDGVVKRLAEGLAAPVQAGGTNFSFGQRQLFCLARALLRHSVIICFDEAAATSDRKSVV